MEKSGLQRRTGVTAWVVAVTLITVGVTLYVMRYYFPVRDAEPVLALLRRGTIADCEAVPGLLLRGPSLRGLGASKVKQAMLNALETSDESEMLVRLFGAIFAGAETGHLVFLEKNEWDTIAGATARYNAKQPDGYPTYYVATNHNGECYLSRTGMRSRTIMPAGEQR